MKLSFNENSTTLSIDEETLITVPSTEDPKECLLRLMAFTREIGFDREIVRFCKERVAEHYQTDDLVLSTSNRESNQLQKEIDFANDTFREKGDQDGNG